ncbi:hypothetical protein J0H58_07860 [bacterium]|nr:hypothetical protein [bacterium]
MDVPGADSRRGRGALAYAIGLDRFEDAVVDADDEQPAGAGLGFEEQCRGRERAEAARQRVCGVVSRVVTATPRTAFRSG